MRPPRLAERLLAGLLPEENRDIVLGDLLEEYRRFVMPEKGRVRARLWYWRQTLASIVPAMRMRLAKRREARSQRRGVEPMFDLFRDVRYGLRMLWKSPLFTVVALTTLALGIGANVTIFAVMQAVLLRPLAFPEPERLVALWEKNPERNWMYNQAAPANFLDWQRDNRSFVGVAAHSGLGGFALSGDGDPEMVSGYQVSGNFFDVLGVRPLVGRTFSMEETWAPDDDVVILSYELWRRRFGGDPSVVGLRIQVDGEPKTVVGVMPEGLDYPSKEAEIWTSLGFEPEWKAEVWFRRAHFLWPIARLKPGVTLEQSREDIESVAARLERDFPETNRSMGAGVTPLSEWMVGDTREPLLVLFAAVGLVLLVASANVANLLLTRTSARKGEIAVRRALGAPRARIARQLLVESALLSGLGGVLGIVLAVVSFPLLVGFAPSDIPRLGETHLDGAVLAFALLASTTTALLFGLTPALEASRGLGGKLRSRRGNRLPASSRHLLVVSEMAIAVVLAAVAGLLVESFQRLTQVSPGFEPKNLWTAAVSLPEMRYPEESDRSRFHHELLERLRNLPGIESAASVDSLPLQGVHWTTDFVMEGRPEGEVGVEFNRRRLSPGYFRTMGVPLRSGRDFADADDAKAAPVVIINERLAKTYFDGADPVGRRIAFENEVPRRWRTIIGVAGDEKIDGLGASSWPEIFVPVSQIPAGTLSYVFRPEGDPDSALRALRREVAALDPALPVFRVGPLQDIVDSSVSRERFLMTLVSGFAVLALVLAAVGIYGVVAYGVSERSFELSLRMALGARATDVVRMLTRETFRLGAIGIGLGAGAALLLGRLLGGLLFGVSAHDPRTFLLVGVIAGSVAYAASYFPARRATRVDPMASLRAE